MGSEGFFGNLFDLNGDGKLDCFEKAADFAALIGTMEDADEILDEDGTELFDSDEDEVDDDDYELLDDLFDVLEED